MSVGPQTVGQIETRLRSLMGHARKRDRVVILEAIEAIHELATRLREAERRPRLSNRERLEHLTATAEALGAMTPAKDTDGQA